MPRQTKLTTEDKEVVAWLKSYKDAALEITAIRHELEHWQDIATAITRPRTAAPLQRSHDDLLQRAVEGVDQMQQTLADRISMRLQKRAAIEGAIFALPEGRARSVLEMRYLSGMTLELVAVTMGQDYRWIQRQHNMAVKALRRLADVETTKAG